MNENTKQRKYRIAIIILSVLLALSIGLNLWEYFRQEKPSLLEEYQWVSLLSNYDDGYAQIQEKYGNIISKEDFLLLQNSGDHSSMIYPVLVSRYEQNGAVFLFRFYQDPQSGSYILMGIEPLSDDCAAEVWAGLTNWNVIPEPSQDQSSDSSK